MPTIDAATVVTPTGPIGPARVSIEGGRIRNVQLTERAPAGDGAARILAPGFVDLQVNGIDDLDVATATGADWHRLAERLLASGVTTWCPTLVTAPLDEYGPSLRRMADAAADRRPNEPAIAGVHLEGPFLGGAPGAHPPGLLRPIDLAWLGSLPPLVRVVTLAPELDGATDAVALLAGRGVLVALGHSTASFEQAVAAVDAGARLVTHLFNGMSPFHHREPGLVGAALADDRLAVSLIADGVHVHAAALTLAMRAKGASGVVLVTDSVAWKAGRVGAVGVSLRDGAPRLPDGTLAGSALRMDAAVRHIVGHAGADLAGALAAASTTPARLLGLADRGAIVPGARADLVALGPSLEIEQVWVDGEPVAVHPGR